MIGTVRENRMRAFGRCPVIAAVLIAAALMLAPSLGAQDPKYKFNVPFQFYSGDKAMPAGEYQLRFMRSIGCISVLTSELGPSALAVANRAPGNVRLSADPNPYMVFYKYGDSYFLRGLRGAVEQQYAWLPSKTEKQVARQVNAREVALVHAH